VDVTSDEIRTSRFQGTRHVYDRREVDAFLHRTAATLELYERKIAVTQAHVESLEKALDLAHGRARAIRSRETRISELESALAAAQHNYESAMAQLEAKNDAPQVVDIERHELVLAARSRVEALLQEAMQEAAHIRVEATRVGDEAAQDAELTTAAAQAEAEELAKSASLEHAAMLEEIAQERLEAKEALDAEIDTKRTAALAELDVEKVRLAGEVAAAEADLEAVSTETDGDSIGVDETLRERLRTTVKRATAAEEERDRLLADIERTAAAAEAERKVFMEDAERMFEEAVARAEADRATVSPREPDDAHDELAAEVTRLRREAAQLRTALMGVQERFSDVSGLSVEELQLSALLAGLEVGGDEVIDLTKQETEEADAAGTVEDVDPSVTVKSKWAESQPMHAAPRADVVPSSDTDDDSVSVVTGSTWRNAVEAPPEAESAGEPPTPEQAVIGFYERRLAGLRSRLKDAAPRDV
jgi:hypothetical protein